MRKGFALFVMGVCALFAINIGMVGADAPTEGRAGRAEMRFLEGMIDHHQMAIDMSNDCLMNAISDEVRQTCQNIIDAQSAEIAIMQEWLLSWYGITYTPIAMLQPANDMAGMDGIGSMDATMEMNPDAVFADPPMMMGMMAGLSRLSGSDYDIAWLESMIDHHDDALHMAIRILEQAQHDDLIALATQIIADQTAEIEQMEALIAQLSV